MIARFDAEPLTSDGGVPLLAEIDRRLGLTAHLSSLLPDWRRGPVVHSVHDLLRQRVYAIVAGYEDGNDASSLRSDPAFKLACGRRIHDPKSDLASQPSLSRFEGKADRRVQYRLHAALVDDRVRRRKPTKRLILDIDSTWGETYGAQQLTFFNGFYDGYGYHPLLVFDAETGDVVLAVLRPGSVGAAVGALAILKRLVARIRSKWPRQRVLLRADAGFAIPEIYDWCEANGVDYVIGLQINPVLKCLSAGCLATAEHSYFGWRKAQGRIGKTFTEFPYQAGPWKRQRRVIAKAEFGPLGSNQRYVVTNLLGREPRQVYAFYCQRGQAENRIKDLKCALSGDRFICSRFQANAFRLILHVIAYRLCKAVSEALSATPARSWQFDTLRLRLLKVAARVEQTTRRAILHLPRSFPYQDLWGELAKALAPPIPA